MTLLVDTVTKILSVMTITSQILIVLFLLYLIIIRTLFKKKIGLCENFIEYFKHNSSIFVFIVALTATLGSLFFSQIAHYIPCELCWYQRIFMYPISIITLFALIFKQKNVYIYTLPLSIIGSFISSYHYYISTFSTKVVTTCSLTGPSCLTQYFTEFNYITFPLMAFTSFLLIIILSVFMMKRQKKIEDMKDKLKNLN